MKRPPALLFGIPLENVTMADTVALVGELVNAGREHGRSHQIATVNVDFLANAIDDPELAQILRAAEVCLADGMPIVWVSSRLDMPLVERVAGADLIPRLMDESRRTGWRIHVLGTSPGVAERAERHIAERYPGAAFTIDPHPKVAADGAVAEEVLDELERLDPDILCVALGNPKQERFIVRHRDRLATPVAIGVGGSIDMMVGERRRAPEWLQRIGLEWMVRAVQEPRRLGVRYARDIRVIGPWLARQLRIHRARRSLPGLRFDVRDGAVDVVLGGADTAAPAAWPQAVAAVATGAKVRIDPGDATDLNDSAAASLVGLVRIASRSNSSVGWVGDPTSVVAALRRLGLDPRSVACDEAWRSDRVQ